jgi:hypothetical protein
MSHPYTYEEIIQACRNNLDQYIPLAKDYIDRGSLHSENLLMCAISQAVEADVIMESGRFKGQSTYCLGKFFESKGITIESIDLDRLTAAQVMNLSLSEVDSVHSYAEQRLRNLSNVRLHYGNSFKLLLRLLKEYLNQRVAIFIDGPKEHVAVDLAFRCLMNHPNIPVVFIHDCPQKYPARKVMEEAFEYTFFSDHKDFLDVFSYLDETCQGEYWQPYYQKGKLTSSYGPTLGIAFPQEEDINRYLKAHPDLLQRKSLLMQLKTLLHSLRVNGTGVTMKRIMENLRR